MGKQRKNKSGQIALWAIVAVIVVIAIIILVALLRNKASVNIGEEKNPRNFIVKCEEQAIGEAIELTIKNGGFTSEPEFFKIYNDKKYRYLCYNQGHYLPCIQQYGNYVNMVKKDINDYLKDRIRNCFDSAKIEFSKDNYNVDLVYNGYKFDMAVGKALLDVDAKITMSKSGNSALYEDFDASYDTPLYDLLIVVNDILTSESKYCYFEYVGYMALYQRFEIEKDKMSDDSVVYNVRDKNTGKEINFAIRGCAIPAGI